MLSTETEYLRLDAISSLEILDTEPEPAFDHITQLASDLFQVPIALISLVDKQRQWFKSCIGLGVQGTPRDVAFCDVAIRKDEVMIVADATKDSRFCLNPLVTGEPHIRFYAGAPIRHRDILIGTLCIIDQMPRSDFDNESAKRLAQLADTVSSILLMRKDAIVNLATIRRLEVTQKKLEMMEEVAGVGYWHLDLKNEKVTWSKGVYTIHGVDRETYQPELTTAINWYHPDDRPKVEEILSHTVATGNDSETELRIIRADGEERKVYGRGKLSYGPDGQPASLFGVITDVTDRRKTQELIEQSEARYRLLADRSNDIIAVYDVTGKFEYISPSIKTVLGYDDQDIIGKTVRDVIFADDIETTLAAFTAYLSSKDWSTGFRVQYRARHADGRLLWLEAHPRPVLDETGDRILNFQDVVRDVTKQVETLELIQVSEARYKLLAENANDLVLQCRINGQVIYASPSAGRITGYEPEQLIGKTWCELLHPEDAETVAGAIRTLALGGIARRAEPLEYRFQHQNGGELWFEGRPTLVFDDKTGEAKGFITIIRDITFRKLAEAELKRALIEAEAATEAKSQFLATMSHEIRTPLTTILGYANLLRDDEALSEEADAFIKRIGKAGKTLLGLVNNVLDVSRFESGQVTLNPQPTNVRELAGDIIEQFQMPATLQGLNLTLDYNEELPDWLLVDDTRLSQVLNNLIGNACKFTSDGEILARFKALVHDGQANARVEIRDSGAGLSVEQIGQLFQRFHQVDSGINRKHGGSGLGLAICSEIIKLMGGRIGVDSVIGTGSTFWFEFPLTTASPGSLDGKIDLPAYKKEGIKVLLVDDNPANRQMLKALITTQGPEVVEAGNGAAAIALCKAQRFDLVFMDIQMPEIDGVRTTELIREQCPLNSTTPVIALTAMSKSQLPGKLSASLFSQVLAKPIDPRKILSALPIFAGVDVNP